MSEIHMSTKVGHHVHRWLPRSAEVCHKVWVVMYDLQRMHPMVVCHRVWQISLGGTQVDVMTVANPAHW